MYMDSPDSRVHTINDRAHYCPGLMEATIFDPHKDESSNWQLTLVPEREQESESERAREVNASIRRKTFLYSLHFEILCALQIRR